MKRSGRESRDTKKLPSLTGCSPPINLDSQRTKGPFPLQGWRRKKTLVGAAGLLLLVMVVLLATNGSATPENSEACIDSDLQDIMVSVLTYNQRLAEGYASMNMTVLRDIATVEQALRDYHHMSALGEANLRMEAELVHIDFLDIQVPFHDTARARTAETWNYRHITIDTQMPSQTVVEGMTSELSYELLKQEGRWVVSSVTLQEDEERE